MPLSRVSRRVVRRALIAAGALALAVPTAAQAAQYAYFTVGATPSGGGLGPFAANLGRVDVDTGTVDYPWIANTAMGGSGFNINYTSVPQSSHLAVAGGYLYFTDTNNRIGRVDLAARSGASSSSSAGVTPNWVALTVHPDTIAVSGGYVYFTHGSFANTKMGRVAIDGSGLTQNYASLPNMSEIKFMRISDGVAYWTGLDPMSSPQLHTCMVAACTPALSPAGFPLLQAGSSMVPQGSFLYQVDSGGSSVNRWNADGTGATSAWWNLGGGTFASYALHSAANATKVFTLTGFMGGVLLYQADIASPWNGSVSTPSPLATILADPADNLTGDMVLTAAPAVPSITSVSPSTGTTAGGTSVTITGTNFTGATAVTFGGTPATSFTVNSATQITATTPARSAGAVAVAVTNADGTDTKAGAFTYAEPPAPTPTPSPAVPAPTAATPTDTWTPPTGREDAAILINNARVDLAATPRVETQGSTTTVVTQMTVDEVGRYTVMYVAPRRRTRRAHETGIATQRVSFAKGTKINTRTLKRPYTAVTFTTTKKGAEVTMRALLKRAKGRKLTLRVIYRSPDGTLKESRIKS